MSYLIEHTVLFDGLFVNGHFNWLHAAFVVAALAIIIFCVRRVKKMKTEVEELKNQLSSKAADITVGPGPEAAKSSPAEAAAET